MAANKKGREIWIDYLKVIAIFLVVFNHLVGYQYKEFFLTTYNIFHIGIIGHIPIFWFCSGYLYKKIGVKDSVKKYFPRLIVPYLFLNLLGIFMGIVLKHWKDFYQIILSPRVFDFLLDPKVLKGIFLLKPTNRNAYMNSPTWFLVSLFVILVLFAILQRYTKDDKQLGIAVLALQVINYLLVTFDAPSYFTINASMLGIFFFYIGYMFRQYDWKTYFEGRKNYLRNIVILVLTGTVSMILFKFHFHFWFFGGKYFNSAVLSYMSALAFMIFFIVLTIMIQRENKLVLLVSVNTLVIMGFDQYFRGYSKLILDITGLLPHVNVVVIFINALVIVLVSTGLAMLLTKYAPRLIGKAPKKTK